MAAISMYEGTNNYETIALTAVGDTHDITNQTRGIVVVAAMEYRDTTDAGAGALLPVPGDNRVSIHPGETITYTMPSTDNGANGFVVIEKDGGALNRTAGHVKT